MDIAIIGKKEVVIGFKALGLKVYSVSKASEAEEKLLELCESDFAIVFITESIAQEIYDTISEIAERTFPAVTIIPEPVGASGFASKVIKDAMLKAVGTDVTAR